MKFSITSLLVLVFTLFSFISASPVLNSKVIEGTFINPQALVERNLKFPVKANDGLVAQIMTSVKADLNAKVFATVTATVNLYQLQLKQYSTLTNTSFQFCEQAAASLKIHASILGGLVKVGEVHLKAIESAAAKNVKVGFEANLQTEVEAKIYAPLEVSLRKSCGSQLLDQVKLLSILTELEAQAQALIKVQLPKIGVSLRAKAKEQIEVAAKGIEVNIPLILQISVDATVNEKATLDASIAAGLQVCAKLVAKDAAKVILAAL